MNPGIDNVVDYHVKGVQQHGKFKVANNAIMQHILSDQLYGDKITAVIRELSTNAFEAHMMDGHNEPFDVHLPTMNEPWFSIRDYGIGLSREKLSDVYCVYGVSDKRDSDDFTGGLGIGSKSPFAYSKMFTVTSYYNGEKIVVINSQDASQNFVFDIISATPTEESNGVEIYFDVEENDIQEFTEKAKEIYRYFKVKPNLTGNKFTDSTRKVLEQHDNWRIVESTGNTRYVGGKLIKIFSGSKVIMGQVAYPIDTASLDSNAQHLLRNCTLEIDAPMGAVQFTPNREALQYTAITKDYINQVCRCVVDHLTVVAEQRMQSCKCMWDARLFAVELHSGQSVIGNIISNNLKYNGQRIPATKEIHRSEIANFHIRRYEQDGNHSWVTERRSKIDIKVSKRTRFVIGDDDGPFASTMRHAEKNLELTFYIFCPKNSTKTAQEFLDLIGISANDPRVLYTSEMPKPQRQQQPKVKRAPADANVYRKTDYGWNHETINLDNESGYYCIVQKGLINGSIPGSRLDSINGKYNIIGVLESRKNKVVAHSNWKPLIDLVKEQVDKAASHPDIDKYTDIVTHNLFGDWDFCLTKYDPSSTMRKNLEKIKANRVYSALVSRLKTIVCLYRDLGGSYELPKWETETINLFAEYPLLKFFRYHTRDTMGNQDVVQYINSK